MSSNRTKGILDIIHLVICSTESSFTSTLWACLITNPADPDPILAYPDLGSCALYKQALWVIHSSLSCLLSSKAATQHKNRDVHTHKKAWIFGSRFPLKTIGRAYLCAATNHTGAIWVAVFCLCGHDKMHDYLGRDLERDPNSHAFLVCVNVPIVGCQRWNNCISAILFMDKNMVELLPKMNEMALVVLLWKAGHSTTKYCEVLWPSGLACWTQSLVVNLQIVGSNPAMG